MKKILLFWLILFLAANASALNMNTYDVSFNIIDTKAVVEIDLLFDNQIGVFEFELPEDNTALSVYVDDTIITPSLKDNILKIDLNKHSRINFNYVSEEFIEKTNFLVNMKFDFNIDDLKIKLILPEGASLKKPIKQGDLISGSIFPKPTKATTDGKSLIFIWKEKGLKQSDEVSIFTQFELKKDIFSLIITLAIVMVIAIILFMYILKKKPKIVIKKESMIEKHLKEDEEQIVNILKNKEGNCEQGTLRVITGFSKATLSRLLSELETRKVIHKEKRGKKNLVFLKK